MSEDLEMQEVPPDFVPPPPAQSPDDSYAEYGEPPHTFPPVHVCCSVCAREMDMRYHHDRASIVRYKKDEVELVYCCACVPADKTPLVLEDLTKELYISNLRTNRQKDLITRLEDTILKSEEEKATLKRKLEKAYLKAISKEQDLRKKLHAEMDDNDKLRHVMRKIRDELQAAMAQASTVMTSRRANFVTTAKSMLNFMNSKCCELYSLSRHTLRRIEQSRMKPIQPSLLEYDSVHPISITENEKSGEKYISFCRVCRGLDDGYHLARQHVPIIATMKLGDPKADEEAWQTLAVPFNEQPIAIQTNGLVQSN